MRPHETIDPRVVWIHNTPIGSRKRHRARINCANSLQCSSFKRLNSEWACSLHRMVILIIIRRRNNAIVNVQRYPLDCRRGLMNQCLAVTPQTLTLAPPALQFGCTQKHTHGLRNLGHTSGCVAKVLGTPALATSTIFKTTDWGKALNKCLLGFHRFDETGEPGYLHQD